MGPSVNRFQTSPLKSFEYLLLRS